MLSGQGLPIHHIRVIFTSTRDAPLRVRSFLNELTVVVPNSIKINRGRQSINEILKKSKYLGASYLVITGIKKGNPSYFRVIDSVTFEQKYFLKIRGVTLLKELKLVRPKNKVKFACISKVDNEVIRNFLLDIGFYSVTNCNVYAYGYRVKEEELSLYELKFLDPTNNILGPIIRFII